MPVFISYSHENKDFVDQLAIQLVQHNVNIWLDRWELSIGDSIIDKVQEAADGASALLVILSNASVASEWCKKELSAGLLRELEEKRVVIMPVLLEDCKIPLFARGKLYADFRTNFDDGLKTVLEGIAKVTNPFLSRKARSMNTIQTGQSIGAM
ncbi:toll/interleukin-1 receptor domain-containing protein [Vibrio metoecus]|uniref:toll/interleukin-1 receptor domain-containing protein n=1 Tax=Vibrio metoecus TaxID=1481663 RepID=UPI0012AEAC94|nr:toll/interleukin-1 receptor domain-containing protein [Vibrio metoecus]